jgi:hypothetical protein
MYTFTLIINLPYTDAPKDLLINDLPIKSKKAPVNFTEALTGYYPILTNNNKMVMIVNIDMKKIRSRK